MSTIDNCVSVSKSSFLKRATRPIVITGGIIAAGVGSFFAGKAQLDKEVVGLRDNQEGAVTTLEKSFDARLLAEQQARSAAETSLQQRLDQAQEETSNLSSRLGEAGDKVDALQAELEKAHNSNSDLTKRLDSTDESLLQRIDFSIIPWTIKKVRPSAVAMTVGKSSMSGAIIHDKDCNVYILTCGHTVPDEKAYMESEYNVYVFGEDPYKGASKIKAKPFKFPNGKPAYRSGKGGDVMLLKPEEDSDVVLSSIGFRDATQEVQHGEPLLNFGAPGGIPNTVTFVSAGLYREISVNGGPLQLYLQLDGQSDLGDSGGPVTDIGGNMVAFVSLTFPGKKVSFAVSTIAVQHWMDENGIPIMRADGEKSEVRNWISSLGNENGDDGKRMLIKLRFSPANADAVEEE